LLVQVVRLAQMALTRYLTQSLLLVVVGVAMVTRWVKMVGRVVAVVLLVCQEMRVGLETHHQPPHRKEIMAGLPL
jgi:uncharacterized membrane protein YeiB